MGIKVNNKFNRGDIVYGAFEPGDVNFEDRFGEKLQKAKNILNSEPDK